MEPIQIVGRVLLVVCVVITTTFPILYSILAPWHRSVLGRTICAQSIVIALAIDLKFVITFFYDQSNRHIFLWINTGILFAIAMTSAMLTYLLCKFQLSARRGERK